MRMSGQEPNAVARCPSHQRMHRLDWTHRLQVAVSARMKVGPTDRWCLGVIRASMRFVGIRVSRVKVLCRAQSYQPRDAGPEVLVVAAEECSAPLPAKAVDVLDIVSGERPRDVRADEPQLLVGAGGEFREVDIVARSILRAVAGH